MLRKCSISGVYNVILPSDVDFATRADGTIFGSSYIIRGALRQAAELSIMGGILILSVVVGICNIVVVLLLVVGGLRVFGTVEVWEDEELVVLNSESESELVMEGLFVVPFS